MNAGKIRAFVNERAPGGLGAKDIQDLVGLVRGDAESLTPAKLAQLQKVARDKGELFTEAGAKAFERLTGEKPHFGKSRAPATGSSAIDVRAGAKHGIPRTWEPIVRVSMMMKKLIDEGDSVTLRLPSGREISLDASEQMAEFAKKGYFKLYKNPKDSEDYDDEGHVIHYPGYYLVPTPAFDMLTKQVEKFAKRADGITKAITTELDKLHDVMHAARVNGLQPYDLDQIKAEVRAERPKAKAAIIAYEEAVQKFAQDTQHLDYPNGEVFLMDFAKKALDVAGPHVGSISLRDLTFTKDLIRASELLLDRPEVESVDPGFDGIRICVNTDVLVKNGGDYNQWKAETTKLLRDHLITGGVGIEKNNRWDGVLDAAQKVLARAVGAANVVDGYQMGDHDFPDHVRGTEVTLYVKPDQLAAARAKIDDVRALFAPHGMDMKHFTLKIEAEDR